MGDDESYFWILMAEKLTKVQAAWGESSIPDVNVRGDIPTEFSSKLNKSNPTS